MKRLFLLITIGCLAFPSMSQSDNLQKIISKLQTYYNFNPSEKAFLSTNKEVFKPGETVWFSAIVNCYTSPDVQDISSNIIVRLYNAEGILFLSDQFKISEGRSKGDFALSTEFPQGDYFLAAYTQLANNEEDVFLKKIIIDSKDEDKIQVEQIDVPDLLKAGENNFLKFHLKDLSNELITGGKVKYKLLEDKRFIDNGKLKVEKDGTLLVSLNLKDKEYYNPLTFSMFDNGKHLNYRKIFQVNTEKLTMNFVPEGGNFVARHLQKIGFNIINNAGQPVEIKGKLVDENEEMLAQIETLIPGYGMFPFKGNESKKYKIELTSELGKGQIFELPEFKAEGMSFAVQKLDLDFINVDLIFADNKQHNIQILTTKGALVHSASQFEVNGSLRVKLSKENFPQGLSLISVFEEEGKLLAERTVYVDQNEGLNVQLETLKQKVASGEPLSMKIQVVPKDGSVGYGELTASVSVFNETLGMTNDFESCFKINAELKHKIPVQELVGGKQNLANSINYMLIANYLKNSSWEKIFAFDEEKSHEFEQGIGGFVYGDDRVPMGNAIVSLVNRKNMQILNRTADINGYFFFHGLNPTDISDYAVKTIGIDGQKDLTVEFNKDFDTKLSAYISKMSNMQMWGTKLNITEEYFKANRQLFHQVKKSSVAKSVPAYKTALQTSTNLLDVIRMIKPFDMMGDKIVFAGSMNSFNAQDGALIVVDGQKLGTSASALSTVSPLDVENINVSTNPVDIQMYTGLNSVGLIEITTKRGKLTGSDDVKLTNEYKDGLRVSRDFQEELMKSDTNLNTALYWDSSIDFNSSTPINIAVPTSNVVGKYLIKVEAVDSQGRIGSVSKIVEVVK